MLGIEKRFSVTVEGIKAGPDSSEVECILRTTTTEPTTAKPTTKPTTTKRTTTAKPTTTTKPTTKRTTTRTTTTTTKPFETPLSKFECK